eukprot:gene8768-1571_t
MLIRTAVVGDIQSLTELNLAIAADPEANPVGFLSEGNYQTVHDVLHPGAVPKIMGDLAELEMAVADGSVSAGLLSGLPTDVTQFHLFSSTLVSPRGMLVTKDRDPLVDALDAAIVRVLSQGLPQRFAEANPPLKMVSVFNCKGEPEAFPYPPLQAGDPPNWAHDGNWQVEPATGYWPDYLGAIEAEFQERTGFGFELVWYNTSAGVMKALEAGEIDAPQPYWTLDSYHIDSAGLSRGRKSLFEISCITMGYESTFFTLASTSDADSGLGPAAIAAIVVVALIAVVLLLAACFVILYMTHREKKGEPVFVPIGVDP